ncbi:MAG: hypothetical protein V1837_05260 [Candidatus Woesearchaeota archaeon]
MKEQLQPIDLSTATIDPELVKELENIVFGDFCARRHVADYFGMVPIRYVNDKAIEVALSYEPTKRQADNITKVLSNLTGREKIIFRIASQEQIDQAISKYYSLLL